jgi:hypothetical protein
MLLSLDIKLPKHHDAVIPIQHSDHTIEQSHQFQLLQGLISEILIWIQSPKIKSRNCIYNFNVFVDLMSIDIGPNPDFKVQIRVMAFSFF